MLAPGGGLFLFYGYGPDDPTGSKDIAGSLSEALKQRGFDTAVERAPDGSSLGVIGHKT